MLNPQLSCQSAHNSFSWTSSPLEFAHTDNIKHFPTLDLWDLILQVIYFRVTCRVSVDGFAWVFNFRHPLNLMSSNHIHFKAITPKNITDCGNV